MPPYLARPQSLFGNVGSPSPPVRQIDVPGAIDALTQGASSLIHGAMLRRQAAIQMGQRQQEIDLAKQRETREAAMQDADLTLRQNEAQRKFLTEGGTPGHTDVTATPTEVPLTPGAQAGLNTMLAPESGGRITRAMRGGADQLPGPELTPSAPQVPTTISSAQPEVVQTPDTYDPTKAAAYVRATETARIRGEVLQQVQGERQAAAMERQKQRQQAGAQAAEVAQQGRVTLEKMREAARSSGIKRPMTANGMANTATATADGILAAHGYSFDEANAWMQSTDPEAVKLRNLEKDLPVSWSTYLANAHAKHVKSATSEALAGERGVAGDEPQAAVDKVNQTRAIVRAGNGKAQTPPAGGTAAPAAPAAAKPAASSPKFTDEEVDAALAAGKTSEADVSQYITEQRQKKKNKGG